MSGAPSEREELYTRPRRVLAKALNDMTSGKGDVRHATPNVPFEQQDMMQAGRVHGLGFPLGQIEKKAREASRMAQRGDSRAAQRELLGVIAYAAGAWLLLAEQGGEDV